MCSPYEILANQIILIVDDSPQITALLSDVFTTCGAEVLTANTGREAIRLISSKRPNLILLDVIVPDIDGWEIYHFIQRVYPKLIDRTIFLTGDRWHEEVSQRLNHIELPVIYKPFDIDSVRAKACDVLGSPGCTAA